jgi:hypothetical protein
LGFSEIADSFSSLVWSVLEPRRGKMNKLLTRPENNTTKRLTALELSVASLQEKSKPWYKDAGTLISLVALVLALTSFGYTSYREINKDKEQKKQQFKSALGQVTSQLNSFYLQTTDLLLKYKDDPSQTILASTVRSRLV